MKNDGQCYIWIPSALTLSRLTADSAALINGVHAAVNAATGSSLKTDYAAGQTHEYYLSLNDLDMGGAPFTRDAEPGMAVCGPISNLSYLPLDYVNLICAFGGDVEAMPVVFELTDLDDEVPASFPDRTYESGTIESPATSVHTWATWGSPEHHPIVEIDGKFYRHVEYGQAGTKLNASHWVNAGLTVKTMAEYAAIQAANAPQLP